MPNTEIVARMCLQIDPFCRSSQVHARSFVVTLTLYSLPSLLLRTVALPDWRSTAVTAPEATSCAAACCRFMTLFTVPGS